MIDKGRKFSLDSGTVLENKGADQTLQNRFKINSKQFRFSDITDIFLDYVSILSYYEGLWYLFAYGIWECSGWKSRKLIFCCNSKIAPVYWTTLRILHFSTFTCFLHKVSNQKTGWTGGSSQVSWYQKRVVTCKPTQTLFGSEMQEMRL